jgi:hypothetical protein
LVNTYSGIPQSGYTIVEMLKTSTKGMDMSTVNYSVPEDVKQEFNQLFVNENKSAILTKLMQQAIAEKKQQQRRQLAIDKILQLRESQAPVSTADIEKARKELRK